MGVNATPSFYVGEIGFGSRHTQDVHHDGKMSFLVCLNIWETSIS